MGYFYPEGLNNINNLIDSFKADIPVSGKKIDAFGIISPHAGYVYSGKIAYEGYSSIDIKNNIIIIGPNHTGLGADYSVMNKGKYDFKDFSVPINSKLADAIIEDADSPYILPTRPVRNESYRNLRLLKRRLLNLIFLKRYI